MYLIPVFRNCSPKTLTLYIHLYSESDRNVWGRVNYCSDSVSENGDMDCVEITNIEVCFYLTLFCILFSELLSKLTDRLPSKTIPSGRSHKSKGKKPAQKWKCVVDAPCYVSVTMSTWSPSPNMIIITPIPRCYSCLSSLSSPSDYSNISPSQSPSYSKVTTTPSSLS